MNLRDKTNRIYLQKHRAMILKEKYWIRIKYLRKLLTKKIMKDYVMCSHCDLIITFMVIIKIII